MSPEERNKALEALPLHIRYWEVKGTEKQFIPYPATWLNGARFEDELDLAEAAPKAVVAAWWTTNKGIEQKGAELGLRPRGNESYHEFKERIRAHLAGTAA